jgi:hypothetical protein
MFMTGSQEVVGSNPIFSKASEVQAVTRGYNYYPGFQHPSSEEAPFMP